MNRDGVSIADARERALAIDPGRSFIVQAPAGSGKTELLIQRFLALLGTVRNPEEILAITFTRKAAGEMRSRLLQSLRKASAERPESDHEARTWDLARSALEQDRKHGWRLEENPSLLSIKTIDSFNAALVRRMPWVSRFGALPEVTDDPETLYRQAAERTLASLGTKKRGAQEVAQVLAHLDNRLDLLRDLLVRMLARRDQWLRHMVWDDHDAQRNILEQALNDLVEQALAEADRAFPSALRQEALILGSYAAANLRDSERPLLALADARGFLDTSTESLPTWLGLADLCLTAGGTLRKRLDKNCGFPAGQGEAFAMKERMKSFLGELSLHPGVEALMGDLRQLPPTAYPEEQWLILQALVELLPLATAELWLIFQNRGATDFASIALSALDALGRNDSPSDLLLKLDARINHILVDEFQDTSYLQFNLLEKLTAGWMPGDARTLFVVGDPMQSIYLFREAEVGLFLRAKSRGIGSVPLEPLTLSSNFRSQQGVVDWVNASFAGLFPGREDEALGGVAYAPARAVHAPLPEPACTIHPFFDRADQAEAQEVTHLVQRSLEAHPNETVAVLVRSRTHLASILPAFKKAGLRFAARDIDILESRPAVRDIIALTRALLHPADRLSWLAVLRAPWCGLLLADLLALCGAESLQTIPALLADPRALDRLSTDARLRAERVWRVLARGMARRGAIGLRRLIEGCWVALGGPGCVDEAAIKDAEAVFTLMDRLDHGGDLQSLDALEEGARKLFAVPDTLADGRLQIMTIHKSKGLEFDTVILPALGRSPAGGDKPLLRWLEHPEFGLLLAPVSPRDGSVRDPIYEAIGRMEREKEDLEVTRLLYVAVTRAKKRLHLLGHAKLNGNDESTPAAGSLLRKIWPVVEGHFLFRGERAGEKVEAQEERGGNVIRRLPLDWRLSEPMPAPLRGTVCITQPSDIKADELGTEAFSGWEAETARHVGTVTHAYLERIAAEGPDQWTTERVERERGAIRRRLNALGVPSTELADGEQEIVRALLKVLGSERGRWILSHHEKSDCELSLSGVVDGELIHAVIDRTFVENGVRWVIDYKVSMPQGNDHDVFYAKELERYRGQLLAYTGLFKALEKGTVIRAALYFPLIDGWCEVPGALTPQP